MELGRLAPPRGRGIATGDPGPGFMLGLAEGIAAPAEVALGLALAEVQLLHGARHEAAALGPRERVSGLSDQRTYRRTQFHGSASLRKEADNVHKSVD